MLTEQQMKQLDKDVEMYKAGKNPYQQQKDEGDSYRYTAEATQPTEKLPERYIVKKSNNPLTVLASNGSYIIVMVVAIVVALIISKKIKNKKTLNTLQDKPLQEQPTKEKAETIIVSDKFGFCPYCGNRLNETFTFCPFCGKQLYNNTSNKTSNNTPVSVVNNGIKEGEEKVITPQISKNKSESITIEKRNNTKNVTYADLISFDGLFNINGRRCRKDYFVIIIIKNILTYILSFSTPTRYIGTMIYTYIGFVNNTKRLHDLNYSTNTSIAIFALELICGIIIIFISPDLATGVFNESTFIKLIPISIVGILPTIYLLFKKGNIGDNQYGPDPLKQK